MRDVSVKTADIPWRARAEKPCAPSHRQSPALQTLTSWAPPRFRGGGGAGLGPWLGCLDAYDTTSVRTCAYTRILMHRLASEADLRCGRASGRCNTEMC